MWCASFSLSLASAPAPPAPASKSGGASAAMASAGAGGGLSLRLPRRPPRKPSPAARQAGTPPIARARRRAPTPPGGWRKVRPA
ncbi:MAG: hypothetical protein LBG47_10600 [Prevotellaceae bacterium]|nr:hypothetical protein [Prevotellaceae bacterium]